MKKNKMLFVSLLLLSFIPFDWHGELRNRNIVPARDLDELFDFYFGIDYINVCAFCWNCY